MSTSPVPAPSAAAPDPRLTAERLEAVRVERLVSPAVAQHGRVYFDQGRVSYVSGDARAARLSVRGGAPQPYRVDVTANARGGVNVLCSCPAFDSGKPCKHIVAGILFLIGHLKKSPPPSPWRGALDAALRDAQGLSAAARRPAAPVGTSSGARVVALFSLQERSTGRWGVYPYSIAAAKLSAETLDDPHAADGEALRADARRLSRQATAVRNADPARFVNAGPAVSRALSLLDILQQSYYGSYHAASWGQLRHVLPLLGGCPVFVGSEQDPFQTPVVVEAPDADAPVRAALRLEESGKEGRDLRLWTVAARLAPDGVSVVSEVPVDLTRDDFLCEEPAWLLSRPAGTEEARAIYLEGAPALFLRLAGQGEITVPAADRADFLDKYLLPLAEQTLILGGVVQYDRAGADLVAPTPRLYLSDPEPGVAAGTPDLRAELRFAYGEGAGADEFVADNGAAEVTVRRVPGTEATLQRVRRDASAERQAAELLNGPSFGLKRDPNGGEAAFRLRARVAPVDFLLRHVPRLAAAGYEVYGEESLRSVRVNRSRPTLSFGVTSGIDWFDVAAVAKFGDVPVALDELRRALRERGRFVKLTDGSVGEIPEEWLTKFRALFALADDGAATVEGAEDRLRLSSTQALLLEQAIKDADGDADVDAEFGRRLDRLKSFDRIAPRPLPEGLPITLYPYQKAGYDWLHFLHDYHFGGCLADDMGLGKSGQALVFLQSLREHAHGAPNLVVVPRSLLFNWQREAQKFTPGLKILVYADGERPKAAGPDAFAGYDLVLTTYGILLRDIERLRKTRFHYAVLDEAQAIKNPLSQTARAARLLNAEHRLTLTGTPVENSSLELWSQFAFLNPGLLGGLERFKEEFASAIEKRADEAEDAARTLRTLVTPFLLRRTKEQVASDLPPRTERQVFVAMDPAQRKLYDTLRDRYRAEVLGLLNEGNGGEGGKPKAAAGKAQIAILEGLLRLRQVCCDPRLVEPGFTGESAKMGALLETLETLRAEGHKALVFSQFTKMLGLVKAELDARGIPYAYLDGRTRDREARVDRFQSDPEVPFFLISLKAGGVGLNLTAADYVLHIDPWWNPAVEQQATDRAHRIGQDKPVFVYRFLVEDSVEEKILTLQERKRALVEQIVSAEAGFLKSLSRADIEALFS
jgi:non-specific serine/threonine protein kinase